MKLTPNFSKSEFESKDGSPMPLDVLQNIQLLAEQLQVIRDEIGQPISITSGWRSAAHNARIGGAKHSYHVRGMAADIQVTGMHPMDVKKIILKLMNEGKILKGGLKAYKSWTHYDIRGNIVLF